MPKSFILLTKQELKIYILLGISLGVTILLRMTISSKITTMKIFFVYSPAILCYLDANYLNGLVSISLLVYVLDIITHCRGFRVFYSHVQPILEMPKVLTFKKVVLEALMLRIL